MTNQTRFLVTPHAHGLYRSVASGAICRSINQIRKRGRKKGDAELNLIKVTLVDIFKAWVSKIRIVVVKTRLSLQLFIAF